MKPNEAYLKRSETQWNLLQTQYNPIKQKNKVKPSKIQ